MQHVSYPEGTAERPFPHHQQQQAPRQVSPTAKPGRSPDAIMKTPVVSSGQQPAGQPVTSRGHTVQVGVVSKPFNLPQQDTSPPGQVNVRTIFCIYTIHQEKFRILIIPKKIDVDIDNLQTLIKKL